jgi:hypothetical protein
MKGIEGHILVDGKRPPKNFKCMTGYVVQVIYVLHCQWHLPFYLMCLRKHLTWLNALANLSSVLEQCCAKQPRNEYHKNFRAGFKFSISFFADAILFIASPFQHFRIIMINVLTGLNSLFSSAGGSFTQRSLLGFQPSLQHFPDFMTVHQNLQLVENQPSVTWLERYKAGLTAALLTYTLKDVN